MSRETRKFYIIDGVIIALLCIFLEYNNHQSIYGLKALTVASLIIVCRFLLAAAVLLFLVVLFINSMKKNISDNSVQEEHLTKGLHNRKNYLIIVMFATIYIFQFIIIPNFCNVYYPYGIDTYIALFVPWICGIIWGMIKISSVLKYWLLGDAVYALLIFMYNGNGMYSIGRRVSEGGAISIYLKRLIVSDIITLLIYLIVLQVVIKIILMLIKQMQKNTERM